MRRTSEHMADGHQAEAKHQGELAKSKRREAEIHRSMHKAAGMSDDQEGPHAQLANECDKAADLHEAHQAKHLEFMAECQKATQDYLSKTIVPDSVHGIVTAWPAATLVPRSGAPAVPQKPNVPVEFEHFVQVDD